MHKFDLNNYNAVIFDCDGVLLDINQNKIEAFKKVVSIYSEDIQSNFAQYCSNSFGVSRYKKFEDFFTLFADKPFEQEEYNNFLEQYSAICKSDYLVCPITIGTVDFLELLKQKGINMFISSGSNQEELRETFVKRKLNKYFINIYGFPGTKNEAVNEILKTQNVNKILFIGDSQTDMEVAKNNNLDFVYMSGYTIQSTKQHELCIQNAISHVNNLSEIPI